MSKKLPQWLQGKPLAEQSIALAEQCAKAFDAHGIDASKLFNGLRIEHLTGRTSYVILGDGEPIQNVTSRAVDYLVDYYGARLVTVQYDENITGFCWCCDFGALGAVASLYPVGQE